MGVSYGICTYLAVEAPLSSFFANTGSFRAVCSRDTQHEVRETAKFCEHCGSPIKTLAIREPTPAFSAFCKREGVDPAEAFYLLKEEGWEWWEGETSYTLNWVEVQFNNSSAYGQPDHEKRMALGFCLDRKDAKHPDCEILSYTSEVFSTRMKALEEAAEAFDLKAEPKLYVQVEYS